MTEDQHQSRSAGQASTAATIPLRLTRQQLEFITHDAPVYVAQCGRDLRYRYVSSSYARRFATDGESVIGKFVWQVVGMAAYQRVKDFIDRALAGEAVDFEEEVPYSVVGTHRVRCAYSPEFDEAGKCIGFVAVCRDVTEDQQATEALRQNEERLRLGLAAGDVGTWDWEIDKNQVTWSDRLYQFHGLPIGSFNGGAEDFMRLVHPDDAARVGEQLRAALDGRSPYALEFRTMRPDGAVRWLSTTGQVFRNALGKPVRMMGATIDVTDRKKAQAELERAKESAEAANRAKDRFLAVLSHELRTPLTPILTAAEILKSDQTLSLDHGDLVGMIARNAELEARLIDDMLDLTRISRGKLELHFGVVSAHEKIREVCAMCESEVRAAQLQLALDLQAEQHMVQADNTRLQQILWNLLKNAVKFTEAGGRITIATRNEDGRLLVSVTDTGVGMTPAVLPKIFDAFQQGSPDVTRTFGGLGLGLTIAKALAEGHGGVLAAHSDGHGLGSTFSLQLPTCQEVAAALASAHSPSGSEHQNACRILLVEDHPDTARIMTRLLHGYGYTVTTADSVASALKAAGAQNFDVIISDLGLPDGSGHDLMRQILSRFSIRGIALSGYGMEEDIQRSHQAGFTEHLTKPVNMQKLRDTIDRLTRAMIPEADDVPTK